jgi:16S rRNA C967 or C1407 C5-methylase (RsmB/RsmF family)
MSTKVMDCATCGQSFPSRSKLFSHLRELGHGVQTSDDNNCAANNESTQEERGNRAYYKYYLHQKIINTEDTDAANEQLWKEVYDNLRTPLPITYRIQESSWVGSDFSANLLALVAKDELHSWTMGGEDGQPKIRITMTKDCHNFNKSRSENSNRDKKLSSLMHALQELGATHRQELVSAIPPLVLWYLGSYDEEHKKEFILADLCAAPGSKSLQLLDLLHSMNENGEDRTSIPNGLIVVNDSDRNRIITLCQRSRRVPRSPMLAINMDARYFPGMRRKSGYKQKYDMVLADVPCSGDGTSRKNKQVWLEWSIPQAMSLHKLQRKILRRGLELLRPGGLLVYSTCSLNPLENEAVVSSVIADVGGTDKVEIVPLPAWLTSKFKAMKGLSTWLVPTSKYGKANKEKEEAFDMYEFFADVPAKLRSGKITPSMFPVASDPELKNQLKHCARFVPIKGNIDSGGFFVACLKRLHVGELGEKSKIDKKKSDDIQPKSDANEPINRAKMSDDNTQIQTVSEADANKTASATKEVLREGDWICEACNKLNFGRRDSRTCIGCKQRKQKTAKTDEKLKIQPLLKSPCKETELDPFLDYFGIPSSNSVFHNVRVIHRKRERTFVLVSAHVASLSISEQWGAFREAGISLITMPTIPGGEESENGKHTDFTLFDEAVPMLAFHAMKRHVKIGPVSFRKALAQSMLEVLKKETAETERIKMTLDLPLMPLCGNATWYESHEIATEPGIFIVSCTCSLKDDVGRFSFWCRRHVDGNITIETSSRILAAMLVVVHTYLGVSPPHASAEGPTNDE